MIRINRGDYEVYYCIKDLCRMFNVTPRTIYRWMEKYNLRHMKISGNTIRFSPADIKNFIEEHMR